MMNIMACGRGEKGAAVSLTRVSPAPSDQQSSMASVQHLRLQARALYKEVRRLRLPSALSLGRAHPPTPHLRPPAPYSARTNRTISVNSSTTSRKSTPIRTTARTSGCTSASSPTSAQIENGSRPESPRQISSKRVRFKRLDVNRDRETADSPRAARGQNSRPCTR